MKVLVVGGGAREHALVRALKRSPQVHSLIVAPGNGGIASEVRCEDIRADDSAAIVSLAQRERIDLVVVGPEAPLVAGLVDALETVGISAFGPKKQGAQLEGSKAFSKQFMSRHGIPTAAFRIFDSADDAEQFVREARRPLVIKADGLAAGKGVVVASDTDEALAAIDSMMRARTYGSAGATVVVEERLVGEEISFHVVTDGTRALELGAAQDHKRIGEGDTGPNTGGMGAYAPVPVLTDAVLEQVRREIVAPTIAGLARDGIDFRGVLFFGLMVAGGRAEVLEYNVRFGDPECAVLLERLDGDLLPVLLGCARGQLDQRATISNRAAIAVVIAAPGYPTSPQTGDVITGLDAAANVPGVTVLHAGTRRTNDHVVTSGGRVLAITASAATLDEAAELAFRSVNCVKFEGAQFRRDIGWRARAK